MKPTTITLKRDVTEYPFSPLADIDAIVALKRSKTRIGVKIVPLVELESYLKTTAMKVAPASKHEKTVGHAYGAPLACALDPKKKTIHFYPVPDEAHVVEVSYRAKKAA